MALLLERQICNVPISVTPTFHAASFERPIERSPFFKKTSAYRFFYSTSYHHGTAKLLLGAFLRSRSELIRKYKNVAKWFTPP